MFQGVGMENIAKQVVSVEEKKCVGYVLKPYIDFKNFKKSGYIIVDEETEQEYFVNMDFVKTSANYLLIESEKNLELCGESEELRKKVISDTGEDFGRISNFVFSGKTLKKVITDKCEVGTRNIVDSGDDVLFVSFKRKKRKFPRFEKEDMKVEIMTLPPVINLTPSHYLGKTATKTLLGMNSELIVKEGDKVTKQIFDKAKRHNKINELFFIIK